MGGDRTALAKGDLDWVVGRGTKSVTDLELILKAPPGSVDLWRRGAVPVPNAAVEEIQSFRKLFEFEDRVTALALPTCPEERSLEAEIGRLRMVESEAGALRRLTVRWLDHRSDCPTCRANEARIAREVGPSPFDEKPGLNNRLVGTLTNWARRPWTLLLSLPAFAATIYAAFQTRSPEDRWEEYAYLFLAGISLKFVFPAATAWWRRLTD